MSFDSFFSRLNPIVVRVLESSLHWPLSKGLMLLTVTGRRSGRRYTIPVGYQRDEDGITVMVSEAPSKTWWRNYREAGPVELRLRGRDVSGEARVVPCESDEFRTRAERTLRRMPWLSRVFGISFDRGAGLSDEQVVRLGEQIAIVRISI